MKHYWITFEDGTQGSCDGHNASDAKLIAEALTGKTVKAPKYPTEKDIPIRPYPKPPVIWTFEHPVYGKMPPLCYGGNECLKKSACPQGYSCSE